MRQELWSWLIADAGLRYDHHSVSGGEWVPQGGLTFLLPSDIVVKTIVSKGFRNPTICELYMYRPANADLEPERLMNYELSFKQHLPGGRMGYGFNVFYIKADNLINTQMVDGRPLNVNTGKTENSGFELLFDWMANSNLRFNANYSFLHTSQKLTAAPKNKLFLGATWQKDRLTLNTGLQWIDGLYTSTSDTSTENYWLWNLTATVRVAKQLAVFAKGENLLAQHYEVNAGFPMPRATVMAGVQINFF